jgi:hypothetical protein
LKCYKKEIKIKDEREGNKLAKKKKKKKVEKQGEKKYTTHNTTRKTKQDKANKEEPSKVKEREEIKSYLNTCWIYYRSWR